MYDRFVRVMYELNMLVQALICLALPVALLFGVGWLLTAYASVGEWIYAVLLPVGFLGGFWSMIRFLLRASAQLHALDAAAKERKKAQSKAQKETKTSDDHQ